MHALICAGVALAVFVFATPAHATDPVAPPCKNGAATCKPWERDWSNTGPPPPGSVITEQQTMKALLLVTWIIAGQTPNSYQVQFASLETCEAARAELVKDAERAANRLLLPHTIPAPPEGYKVESERSPLALSALCVLTGSN